MILIADSGSTKTSWITVEKKDKSVAIETKGINPVRDSQESIRQVINNISDYPKGKVEEIHFFGAGCIKPYSDIVKEELKQVFPSAEIQVESDMLGAAIALCGHQKGIACILGTGANSCLFDGEKIIQQTPALGYILGDEGSGASLGKHLVSDIFKKKLPEEIISAFQQETNLTQQEVIERVYRKPQPNLFLSSFVPFLLRHIEHPAIDNLVVDEFCRFLNRNIKNYNHPELPVNFVGGITNGFAHQLKKAIEKEQMIMGKTIQKPINEIAEYYFC